MSENKHNIPVTVENTETEEPKLYEFGLSKLTGSAFLAAYDKKAGFRLQCLEDFQPHPSSRQGTYKFNDIESFGRFIKEIETEASVENTTRLYRQDNHVTAVFDDHGLVPGRRAFKAVLSIPFHEDFIAWTDAHKEKFSEDAFIEFIAIQKHNALDPEPMKLYDSISKLDIESFRNRTSDKGALSRKDTTEASARVRSEVPETIKVRTFVFDDFAVEMKLRIHVCVDSNLGVSFRLVIEGFQKLMDLVNEEISGRVHSQTGIKPLHGVHG